MKRIVYVESAAVAGGSTESLLTLLGGLDRARWSPQVYTFVASPALARLAALGIPAESLGIARPATWQAGALAEGAKARRPVQGLRRLPGGAALYHGVGQGLKFLRHTVPQARRLAARLRRDGADLVHTNVRVGYDRIGILAARLAGRPVVAHVRDWDPLGPLDTLLLRGVGHLIYISEAVASDHRRQGVPARMGTVIPNAVDLPAFAGAATPEARQELRAAAGWPKASWVVGLVGRGDAWKGHLVFLEALARLRQTGNHPLVRGLIVGQPGPQSAAYWREVEGRVEGLGLREVVHFAGQRDDMPRVLGGLDLLAHCSTTPEPFGRVLIEAGAAGLPVVAADAGGVPEIVRHGESGLLVAPGDAEALAGAIGELAGSPERARRMGQAGQACVATRFGVAQHVAAVEAVYAHLLGSDA